MLVLHNAAISTCSQKVRLILAEKGLPFDEVRLSFDQGDHLKPDYLALNPNGVVPTLVHDGQPVTDSSVIGEYLDEVFPEPPLLPRQPLPRARVRAWRQYIDEVATPSIRVPSFNAFFVAHFAHLSEAQFRAFAEARPLRRDFYLKMGTGGFPAAEVEAAMRRLRETLQRLQATLEGQPWIGGDAPSLADIALLPTVVRLEDLGETALWRDLPRVAHWYARLQARPSFAAAFYPGSRDLGPAC